MRILVAAPFALLVGCGSSDSGGGAPGVDAGSDAPVADSSAGDGGGGDAGPTGAPKAEIPTADIDFGQSDCGGAPAGQKTLTVKNIGTGPLTWRASLANSSAYFLIGDTSGTIQPGGFATVTISASAVAASTAAGTVVDDTLSVTTNDAAHAKTDLKVKLTASGATISVTPSAASFGLVPLNQQAADIPIAFKNTGNKPVKVSFGVPIDNQFSMIWQGAPADVTLAPGASVQGLAARFKPNVLLASASSSSVTVSGAVCGAAPKEIALTGQGTAGVFSMNPAMIDFGATSCGSTASLPAAQRTITVGNGGNAPFTFTATLGQGNASPYTIQVQGSPVQPNGTATVVITPNAIPSSASVAANAFGDTLTITSNIPGDAPHTVDLRQSASGAILQFQPATPIAFGAVPINTTATANFTVANVGTAPATVTAAVTNGPVFSLSTPSLGPLAGGDTAVDTLTFAPTTATTQNAAVSLKVAGGDVLCAPLPTLNAAGTGTNGVVNVSPSSLDFGQVNCGTRAGTQNVTVTNAGNGAFNITQLAFAGGNYAVSPSNVPISVPAGGNVQLTVTPITIPVPSDVTPDLYADQLTISTDAVGDTGHVVPLHMTARGVILTQSTDTLAFGGQPINTTTTQQLSITNNGNVPVAVSISNANNVFSFSPQGASVNGGSGEVVVASFKPTATVTYSDTGRITVPGGTPLCAALPGGIALSGQGTNGAVQISPTNLDVGLVPCGTRAPDQNVSIQNTGSAPFNWTATLTAGGAYYALNQTSGTVDPGTAFNLVISPRPIPSTSLTTSDLYAGTVTIQTDIAGDSPHQVQLHETAQGARLTVNVSQLAFGGVAVGSTKSLPFRITNSGNATANVAYAGFQSPPFDATPTAVPILGGSSLNVSMRFSPQAPGAVTGQSLSVQTSDLLCAPLPAAITLSGTGQ